MHPGWAVTEGVNEALEGGRLGVSSIDDFRTAAQGADTIIWLGCVQREDALEDYSLRQYHIDAHAYKVLNERGGARNLHGLGRPECRHEVLVLGRRVHQVLEEVDGELQDCGLHHRGVQVGVERDILDVEVDGPLRVILKHRIVGVDQDVHEGPAAYARERRKKACQRNVRMGYYSTELANGEYFSHALRGHLPQ